MNIPLLPTDLINYILELSGYHQWRHGKYMRKLRPIYLSIAPIQTSFYGQNLHPNQFKEYTAHFTAVQNNKLYDFYITTEVFMNRVHWFLDVFDAENYKIARKKCLHYVFNEKNKKKGKTVRNV
jgi:hypothetical protein